MVRIGFCPNSKSNKFLLAMNCVDWVIQIFFLLFCCCFLCKSHKKILLKETVNKVFGSLEAFLDSNKEHLITGF